MNEESRSVQIVWNIKYYYSFTYYFLIEFENVWHCHKCDSVLFVCDFLVNDSGLQKSTITICITSPVYVSYPDDYFKFYTIF